MKKYIVGLITNLFFYITPIILVCLGFREFSRSAEPLESAGSYFIVAIIIILVYLGIRKPLLNLLADGRMDVKYDEFGRSKKKGNFKMLSQKEQDEIAWQNMIDLERVLSSSVINKITKAGSKKPEKDLEKMIGLVPVKNKVNEMSARMKFEKESNKNKKKKDRINSMSGRHMVFYGSAGTGKTTTARIITGFLYKYGYIKENKCIEVDGNFLKAGRETAAKVKLITQQAYGGVLFIDEAYTLYEGEYGGEAIATLIKEMEDNRDRFICILAGYTKDMNRLLESNTGFKSRIKEYLDFPDYSIPEMKEIFVSMANEQGFAVSGEALERLEIRLAKEKELRTFGNGRTVRNVLDEAVDKHAFNYVSKAIPETERYRICGKDIDTALKRNGIT